MSSGSDETEIIFKKLNKNTVLEMVKLINELDEVYSKYKNEEKVDDTSFDVEKDYLYIYRNAVELSFIGSRKSMRMNVPETVQKINYDDKIDEIRQILNINNN